VFEKKNTPLHVKSSKRKFISNGFQVKKEYLLFLFCGVILITTMIINVFKAQLVNL